MLTQAFTTAGILPVAFLSIILTACAAPAQDVVDVALREVGTGSVAEMKGRILSLPITVRGPESRTKDLAALPESIRRNRITEGKLLRRVERVIKPLVVLHDRTRDLELLLYRGDTLRGMLWRGSVLVLSDSLAGALGDEELAGIVAHELGHSYFMGEIVAAQKARDYRALRVVELKCDAVAMLSLRLSSVDPGRHLKGVEKVMSLNNREQLFPDVRHEVRAGDEQQTHPTFVERARFARSFIRMLKTLG